MRPAWPRRAIRHLRGTGFAEIAIPRSSQRNGSGLRGRVAEPAPSRVLSRHVVG